MPQGSRETEDRLPQSPELRKTIARAAALAGKGGQMTPAHLALALLDDPDAAVLFASSHGDRDALSEALRNAISGTRDPLAFVKILETAERAARMAGRQETESAVVLATLLAFTDEPAAVVLAAYGVRAGAVESPEAAAHETNIDPYTGQDLNSAKTVLVRHDRDDEVPNIGASEGPPRARRGLDGRTGSGGMRNVPLDHDVPGIGASEGPPPGNPVRRPSLAGGTRGGAASGPPSSSRRIGSGERIGAAPRERAEDAAGESRETDILASAIPSRVQSGKLVENIPRTMRLEVPEEIEVRIAREESEALLEGLRGSGEAQTHDVVVTTAMTVRLWAPRGGFVIEGGTPDTQWIDNRLGIEGSPDFGSWRWTVTPKSRGRHTLQILVSARAVDENGHVAESPLPDQSIVVGVRVNYVREAKRAAKWAAALIAGSMITQYWQVLTSWIGEIR